MVETAGVGLVRSHLTAIPSFAPVILTRMNVLTDFANRIPELYLKATLEEKRMILTTIAEKITIDAENRTIKIKLRPVFEHLRLAKQSL